MEYEKAIANNPSLYQSVNRPKKSNTYLDNVTADNLNDIIKNILR